MSLPATSGIRGACIEVPLAIIGSLHDFAVFWRRTATSVVEIA